MKTKINNFIVILLITCLVGGSGMAQEKQKLAQSGFQFLSVVSDAQGAAMAEALTSMQIGSSALFFNPAGMAEMTTFLDATASINQWIADIRHTTFSLAISPAQGNYGVIGFSLQSVDYGDFYGTLYDETTPLGYKDMGIFNLNALAVGLGYAKQLTDRFSVGGHVRLVQQDLGSSMIPLIGQLDEVSGLDTTKVKKSNKLSPYVFDFGTQFKTGIKSLVFGMSVRNFSKEVKYVEEGFQAPLVFSLGISMNMFDLMKELPMDQALYMSVDACHHRDHPEQVKIGLEYKALKMLSLRGGYVSNNDENGITYGVGISRFGFTFDYAYTPFGIFDKVHRMTVRFSR
jgi:hypothetical protein